MSTNQAPAVYLLSIRGVLAPSTVEAARKIHNETAGAPANVAAARSLGDLSHMVYVPIDHASPKAGEFLILDQWNNLDGLNQFFANKQVQEQAGQIFSQRDPVVWAPAADFTSYHFPAPHGRNDRIVGVVRGMVRSQADAQTVHNAVAGSSASKARMNGNMSHEAYFRMATPGTPEALEFLAVDVWYDAEGMNRHYADPEFMGALMGLFATPPSATIWVHPAGEWVEW
ncbi:MAG TPA: hypothetical protein VMT34_03075 [Aggregatilineales bacterium]|nr:hypothetical protein [Aggregatilineales bacterium]